MSNSFGARARKFMGWYSVNEPIDQFDQFEDFDPREHYALTVGVDELTTEERVARGSSGLDGIDLDLSDDD